MAKKSRKSTHKRSIAPGLSHVDKLHETMQLQIQQGNYEEAIRNGELLLRYLPSDSPLYVIALDELGAAYSMSKQFDQGYKVYTQAIDIEPDNPILWFNRGMVSRFVGRSGQSVYDFERAAALNTDADLAKEIGRELKQSRKTAQRALKKRSRGFTLDQLIEQENYLLEVEEHLQASRWTEVEKSLRSAIAVGDCLPSLWGNLGLCLIMQERYEEAEAAFKRALELDRWYAPARHNLKVLPDVRRNGPPKTLGISDSSKRVNITKFVEYK